MYGLMYDLIIKACPLSHCHSSFLATGALGHTHVRLEVAGIQNGKKAQFNTRATSIIIHTNINTVISTIQL